MRSGSDGPVGRAQVLPQPGRRSPRRARRAAPGTSPTPAGSPPRRVGGRRARPRRRSRARTSRTRPARTATAAAARAAAASAGHASRNGISGRTRREPAELEQRARAAAAVLEVLLRERLERVAREVVHDDVARQVDLAAGLEDALVELGVLVRDRAGIPQPDGLEHAAAERAEEHGVDEALGCPSSGTPRRRRRAGWSSAAHSARWNTVFAFARCAPPTLSAPVRSRVSTHLRT